MTRFTKLDYLRAMAIRAGASEISDDELLSLIDLGVLSVVVDDDGADIRLHEDRLLELARVATE